MSQSCLSDMSPVSTRCHGVLALLTVQVTTVIPGDASDGQVDMTLITASLCHGQVDCPPSPPPPPGADSAASRSPDTQRHTVTHGDNTERLTL